MAIAFAELKEMITKLGSYDFYKTYYGRDTTGRKDPDWEGPPPGFREEASEEEQLDETPTVTTVTDISTLTCKLPLRRFCERLMSGYYDAVMIRACSDNPAQYKGGLKFSMDIFGGKENSVIRELRRLQLLYNEDFKAKPTDDPIKQSPVCSPTFLSNA